MKCPRCKTEYKDSEIHWGEGRLGKRNRRGFQDGPLFHWCCTACMQWWFDPRAVKLAFAAYERALTLWQQAYDAHTWAGEGRRLRAAEAAENAARNARAKAEGKEAAHVS